MKNTALNQAGERAQHTPGPWAITERATSNFNEWRESTSETLDSITIETRGSCHVTDEIVARVDVLNPAVRANARLIAAAPELLEALKHAVTCLEYCRKNHKDVQHGSGYPVELMWKDLISKAEGSK